VAASLTAGLPTLIHPFFGDQFFWAARVTDIGAGMRVASLSAKDFADALTEGCHNRIFKERAEQIGVKLRAEDGCGVALEALHTFMSRARRERRLHEQ